MCVTYVSCTCTNCTWVVLFDLFISHVQSYWQSWGTHVVHNCSHLLSMLKLEFMKGILPILYWNRWSPLARLGIRYSLWGGLLPKKSLSDCLRPYLLKLRHPTDPCIGSASWLCYQGIAFYGLFHHVQKWYANTFLLSQPKSSDGNNHPCR